MRTRVVAVPLSISNAYLLLGDRPVLVDTGVPGEEARLAGALRAHGVAPQDLALIALTHGPLTADDVRRRLNAIAPHRQKGPRP
jgi:glyoxylase-like metal-dependent hydrolase (beta-lactamase superfamily II)